MKYTLVALLLLLNAANASAQKHALFADAGLCFDYITPGGSATYNYNPVPYVGLGMGVQAYTCLPTIVHTYQFTPAVFADAHFNIRPGKRHQFFTFMDFGINFYRRNNKYVRKDNVVYDVPKNNGFYVGLGLGYFCRITKQGWGTYLSLKAISNSHKQNAYNFVTKEEHSSTMTDATLVVSLGFKFCDFEKPPSRKRK